jgi:hypothetical protein
MALNDASNDAGVRPVPAELGAVDPDAVLGGAAEVAGGAVGAVDAGAVVAVDEQPARMAATPTSASAVFLVSKMGLLLFGITMAAGVERRR